MLPLDSVALVGPCFKYIHCLKICSACCWPFPVAIVFVFVCVCTVKCSLVGAHESVHSGICVHGKEVRDCAAEVLCLCSGKERRKLNKCGDCACVVRGLGESGMCTALLLVRPEHPAQLPLCCSRIIILKYKTACPGVHREHQDGWDSVLRTVFGTGRTCNWNWREWCRSVTAYYILHVMFIACEIWRDVRQVFSKRYRTVVVWRPSEKARLL